MKPRLSIFFTLVVLFLTILPSAVNASTCDIRGYTVIFVNGVWDNKEQAKADELILKQILSPTFNNEPLTVKLEYNQSHFAGGGDLAEIIFPALQQYDLNIILQQMQNDVHTQKLLIVGHSQGASYANKIYEYLTTHGVATSSVAVYAVATPESYVAGNGKYITYDLDDTITAVAPAFGLHPLPTNATLAQFLDEITAAGSTAAPVGHSFVETYLLGFPTRIVNDIDLELSGLTADSAKTGACLTAPPVGAVQKTEAVALAVSDPIAGNTGVLLRGGWQALAAVGSAVGHLAQGGWNILALLNGAPGVTLTDAQKSLNNPDQTSKDFTVTKVIYGSSLNQSEVKDLLTTSQGGAALLALQKVLNKPAPKVVLPQWPGVVLGTSTVRLPGVVDNEATSTLNRKIGSRDWPWPGGGPSFATLAASAPADIISATSTPVVVPAVPVVLFTATTTPPTAVVSECAQSLNPSFCFVADTHVHVSWGAVSGAQTYTVFANGIAAATTSANNAAIVVGDQSSTTISVVAYDASSTPATSNTVPVYVFSKPVIINEIGWAGTKVSADAQWVEFKNRSPYSVDATHLVLVATDGGSQYISLANVGTIPGPNDYPAFGFRVINRTVNAVQNIDGATTLPFDALSPTGEQLALVYAGASASSTWDQTPAVAACNGWCGGAVLGPIGDIPSGMVEQNTLSMERALAYADGTSASSWHSNDGYTTRGTDSSNGNILLHPWATTVLATPRSDFSAASTPLWPRLAQPTIHNKVRGAL
jgi:hypothetical protein